METISFPHLTRIVLTGSESVGKTTLATQLATHYGVAFVPEFVRDYAIAKAASLTVHDTESIARGQMLLEDTCIARATSLLIQDTDLISTVVYSHHYFGHCPSLIEDAARTRLADMYLLLDTDVPWVADAVRDRGDHRDDVQQQFIETLTRFHAPVTRIFGNWAARFALATAAIDAVCLRMDQR